MIFFTKTQKIAISHNILQAIIIIQYNTMLTPWGFVIHIRAGELGRP